MTGQTILVVEDDPALSEAIVDTLNMAGYQTLSADDGEQALNQLAAVSVDMMLTDLNMKPMNGETLLQRVREQDNQIPVVVMTAHGTVDNAINTMKLGAVDFLTKPFEVDTLIQRVGKFLPQQQIYEDGLVAEDAKTKALLELSARVAESDVTVMVCGESGTGKEVFARYIHNHSPRANGPFVAINCAAIPENMLEAVLFGHEKGAYTGAHRSSPGKFEQAQGGTLLLDEISEMSLPLQAKLLRVLQEREVERLGGRELIQLDVRVLATSNRRLREEVAAGRFREDLFYRLNVFPIGLPPLRDRIGDIMPLAMSLLARHSQQGQAAPVISESAQAQLLAHNWPGNIRELDNIMQRAWVLSNGREVTVADLHFESQDKTDLIAEVAQNDKESGFISEGKRLSDDLKSVEAEMLLAALREHNGSRKLVAEKFGISPRTLRYKLAKLRDAGMTIPA